jgi:DNA repair protein SbcD/Mre11
MLPIMTPSRRPLRVLHTADVHLDGDGYGNAEHHAAHQARGRRIWSRIIDRALEDQVDVLLIAGDLFDHNGVADETIAFVRGELGRLRQPVVILPGNHDALGTGSIYDRHDFTAGANHVHVIRRLNGDTVELPELDVVVWGRAMEEHTPTFQPLAHIPARDDRRWCLAMAHGFFYSERQRPERSSPIFADEVRDTGWDYVALGHHHVRADVSQGAVTAYYAGAPIVEWGDGPPEGSALQIHFSDEAGVRVESRRLR